MADYSAYVLGAYGIALAVYGGATLWWRIQAGSLRRRLERIDDHSAQ
ncbi:MAG: heme exporter protein CcmD [Magnetococcales bacterium]|nr:heme exporter protein CcmD [Magnetococcales bacterium]